MEDEQALGEARLELSDILLDNEINILGHRRPDQEEDVHFALIDAATAPHRVREWVTLCDWLEANYEGISGTETNSWQVCFPYLFANDNGGTFSAGAYLAALIKLDLRETRDGLVKRRRCFSHTA